MPFVQIVKFVALQMLHVQQRVEEELQSAAVECDVVQPYRPQCLAMVQGKGGESTPLTFETSETDVLRMRQTKCPEVVEESRLTLASAALLARGFQLVPVDLERF